MVPVFLFCRKCECDDEYTGSKCEKSAFVSAKKINVRGSQWTGFLEPDLLKACMLSGDRVNGACPAYSLTYKSLCFRVSQLDQSCCELCSPRTAHSLPLPPRTARSSPRI